MRIVIVGDGKIGSALAEQLSREGHEITIVDRSGTPLQRTVEDLDILSVEGNGATYATQIEAGVDEADLLGLPVYDGETPIGRLTDVMSTPANDVYVVKGEDGQEHLIPAVPEFILERNVDEGYIRVRLIEGM